VSAANWLLHGKPAAFADPVVALRAQIAGLSGLDWRNDLEKIAAGTPESIAVVELPAADAPRYVPPGSAAASLQARPFRGRIDSTWRISSFTALTAARDDEQPDFDRATTVEPGEPVAGGIHGFPRGVKAGVCLHEIFQELDFSDERAIEPLVARKLAAFSFDPSFVPAVTQMVRATLQVPLAPGLKLADIGSGARLAEMEFYFPFRCLEASALAHTFGELPTSIGHVKFEPQRGFLKGFIDLVFEHGGRFYIVDWKSNWLGPDRAAYTLENMRGEMTRHHYVLQSHLYVIALHRFLALRKPRYRYAEHFGGVFYLFLRGIDPSAPEFGVFGVTRAPRGGRTPGRACPSQPIVVRLAGLDLRVVEVYDADTRQRRSKPLDLNEAGVARTATLE
jgi:exodeoxyribonuclease V beta subunit